MGGYTSELLGAFLLVKKKKGGCVKESFGFLLDKSIIFIFLFLGQ